VKSAIHRYRANAEQCLILAERATTEETRAEYKQLAEHWLQMATDAEALEQVRERLDRQGD
jgi:hypothetical protein